MRIIDDEKGSFLAHAMVLIALLGLVTSLVLRLSLGRRVIAHRADESAVGRQLLLGVQSHLHACLDGTGFGRDDCTLPASAGCPLPSIGGRTVNVATGGVPPDCRIRIRIED